MSTDRRTECFYCGHPADALDHVVPRSRGGTNHPSNLVPACHSCNSGKRARTIGEYRLAQARKAAGVPYFTPSQLVYLERIGVTLPTAAVVFHGERPS